MRRTSCLLGAVIALTGIQFAVAQTLYSPDRAQDDRETPPVTAPEAASGATSGGNAVEPQSGRTPEYTVGTIVQTQPPTRGMSAAELSGDPLVMAREARAQAREEYREREREARREYRAEKREARREYRDERREADRIMDQQMGK